MSVQETCGNFTLSSETLKCYVNNACDGNVPKAEEVDLLPFKDFCGFNDCYNKHVVNKDPLTDIEQPCFRYRCIESADNPLYEQYRWCGFDPMDPQKLVLPLVLIAALCLIIFYMAYASCRERSQRLKTYMKSQNSYGKLKNDQANNKH